jgi:urease accessory protein
VLAGARPRFESDNFVGTRPGHDFDNAWFDAGQDAGTTGRSARNGDRDVAGTGHLVVERAAGDAGGRSVVTSVRAASPLKLLTPRNAGPAAWVYASTYGGGLVNGDALRIGVAVGPAATVVLSTQASTKVYRSPDGTRSDIAARVADGGTLVSMPDPVVCFTGAGYEQHQAYDLAPGASLVVVDWLSCGRLARGERWAFDRYRSTLRVSLEGRIVCHDALTLSAEDGSLPDRLDRFETLATVTMIGPRFEERARALVARSSAEPPVRRAWRLLTAAPLAGGAGCLVRLASTSLEDAGRAIRQALDVLPALLGDDPWARKW